MLVASVIILLIVGIAFSVPALSKSPLNRANLVRAGAAICHGEPVWTDPAKINADTINEEGLLLLNVEARGEVIHLYLAP